MAQRAVMPMGIFYSPFLAESQDLKKGTIPTCTKCKAGICIQARRDKNMGKWSCSFCNTDNSYQQGFGVQRIEESY
jgi:hypothetical protein